MDTGEVDGLRENILCEFLEVAIHCILYTRRLYSHGVFKSAKKYNIPVQMCIHPDVTKYVKDILDSLRCLLKENSAEQLALVIVDKDSTPVERFVFELSTSSINTQGDRFLYDLEQSLRAFLLKLGMADALLHSTPSDCTWSIHVTTKQSAAEKMNEERVDRGFPWVEVSPTETQIDQARIVPLRSVNSHFFNMQLYVEEKSN